MLTRTRPRSTTVTAPTPVPSSEVTAAPPRGLLLAIVSAAGFGLSGSLASLLFDAGWSPGAAVLVRIGGAALLLAPLTIRNLVRQRPSAADTRMVVLYGLTAVAGAQAAFFAAIQYLSVGVALLLEYLAPVLLVLVAWAVQGRRPSGRTLVGAVVALVGLLLVLDIGGGANLDPLGVMWGLVAAACLCAYFVISARPMATVSPTTLAGAGLLVATVVLGVLGATGVLELRASTQAVDLRGLALPWWLPLALLASASGAFAYVTGIHAAGRLGTRIASFTGLTEVLFAVAFAWLVVAELPVAIQALGGVVLLAGVALVTDNREPISPSSTGPAATDG